MLGFYFLSFTVTFERNSFCCIRFHFPYGVFDFALLSLSPYLLIRYKFVLRHFTKNAKRRLQSVMYSYRAQVSLFCCFCCCCCCRCCFFYSRSFYNREPPQERERHKNHKLRLATLPVYHAIQYCETSFKTYQYSVGVSSNRLYELSHFGRGF